MTYDNLNYDASLLRDTFLKAEKDYVLYLIRNSKEVRDLILELNETYTSESLFKRAEELVSDVDNGLIPDEKMSETEMGSALASAKAELPQGVKYVNVD